MVKATLLALTVAALATAVGVWAQNVAQPTLVDYDTFMQLDVQGRLRLFNQITPENRAELVRAQVRRWVDQNRERLTPEQVAAMEDNLTLITADLYSLPRTEEKMEKVRAMEARTAALFSREDMAQAMTIHATYIPRKD